MNLTMALGMKQHPVVGMIATAVGSPDDMMVMPSSQLGNFLLAYRTQPILFLPELEKLPTPFEVVSHFDTESAFKIQLPVRIVGIGLTSDFDMAFDGHLAGIQ